MGNFAYTFIQSALHSFLKKIEASGVGSRLASGVFWSIAGAVISRGLMLLSFILVARMLGQVGFGEFGMIRSTVSTFSVFAGFGLGVMATKHIAEYCKHDPERAGRVLALSGVFAVATGGVVAIVVYIFAPWLAIKTINAPQLVAPIRVSAFILLINGLNGAQTGALAGFEDFKTIAKVNVGVGLSSFPLLVGGAYLGGVLGAVWALFLNMLLNWFLNHLALRRVAACNNVPFTYRNCLEEYPILLKFCFPAALSGFMVSPVFWACNAYLVNQPGGYAQMGIFDAANQWRTTVLFIPGMVAQVTLPMLSSLHGAGDSKEYMKVLRYNVALNARIGILAAILVSSAGAWIMGRYGEGFEDGYWVLVFLVFSSVFASINQVVGQSIASKGRMWFGFLLNSLWGAALLGFGYLFVSNGYGALGLSLSYLIAYMIHTFFVAVYSWRLL